MDEMISVDTDGLLKAVPALTSLGESVATIAAQLRERLNATGPVWGDDATGHAFETNYHPPSRGTIETLSGTRDVLMSTAAGLEAMAKHYVLIEEHNKAAAGGNPPAM